MLGDTCLAANNSPHPDQSLGDRLRDCLLPVRGTKFASDRVEMKLDRSLAYAELERHVLGRLPLSG